MNLTVHISPDDSARLLDAIQRMADITGRDTETVVRNVGRDFVREAVKLSPIAEPAKSTLWIRAIPGWNKRGARMLHMMYGFDMAAGKKGGPGFWKPVKPGQQGVKASKAKPYTRGMTKAGWMAAGAAIGLYSNMAAAGRINAKYGKGKVVKTSDGIGLEMSSQAPAVERISSGRYPGGVGQDLLQVALTTVITKTEERLEKMEKSIAAKFHF